MKILIVDDEAPARRRLASLVEVIGREVTLVGEAASGLEALALVRSTRPDVLLLDIAMPEIDGFDVVRHLPQPRPQIIFQTAYHEHALRAFEHQAIDYLVKPVGLDRLIRALERAREQCALRALPAHLSPATWRRLRTQLGYQPVRPARLLVRHEHEHRLVAVSDITCFVAEAGLVYAETTSSRSGTDYTLKELDDRMGGTFVRVNRACLVNVARIDAIASNGDGSATLTVAGRSIHVSRRRSAAVRTALQG